MARLDEIVLPDALQRADRGALTTLVNIAVWKLYEAEKDLVIFSINLLVYRKTVRVADARWVLVRWLGEPVHEDVEEPL